VAGFDPSGGAGVLADAKTFENQKVLGLGVVSAITYQHESLYIGTNWLSFGEIKKQLEPLFEKYKIDWVKIGLIENFDVLTELVDYLITQNSKVRIILDPILKATAAKESFNEQVDRDKFRQITPKLFMITPNWEEIKLLLSGQDPLEASSELSMDCHVFLKGGHRAEKLGYDTLFVKGGQKSFSYKSKQHIKYPKHGSGCVLSSAILANLAKGYPLHKSCLLAKRYIEDFLNSNSTLLGWHNR
jgi:hydroxymethylpyrimidine/phosphomethylpyrimidine kinase